MKHLTHSVGTKLNKWHKSSSLLTSLVCFSCSRIKGAPTALTTSVVSHRHGVNAGMVGVIPARELMCVTSRVAGCGWDKWGCGQRWLSEAAGFSAAAFVWNWRGFRCQRLQISDPTDPIQAAQSSGETSATARRMSAGVNIRLPVYLSCTGRRHVVFRCLWKFISRFIYLAFLFSVFYSWLSFCSSASVNPTRAPLKMFLLNHKPVEQLF